MCILNKLLKYYIGGKSDMEEIVFEVKVALYILCIFRTLVRQCRHSQREIDVFCLSENIFGM